MISIQQLSLEIGIRVDTLRVWERRYGFPLPVRDSRGHRCYSDQQIDELRVVKNLQLLGFRPNKVFALSSAERKDLLLQEQQKGEMGPLVVKQISTDLSPLEIEGELRRLLRQLGLEAFVQEIAVPLIQTLDHGWVNGSISIAREHLVSDQLENLLKEQLKVGMAKVPRHWLLFLTLSGERHKLGLLLSAVLFQKQGISCIFLNEEIPLSEVPALAEQLKVSAVAVSFSAHSSARQAKKDLASLRNTLSPQIALIAGGYAVRKGVEMPNLFICSDLKTIPKLSKRIFCENSSLKRT